MDDVSILQRVRLENSQDRAENVVFNVTPDLSETRNVNYKTIDPVHAPGQIYAYVNSASRQYNLSNVMLISRTTEEADRNLQTLWRLRGWTMPYFGKSTLGATERGERQNAEIGGLDAGDREFFGINIGKENRGRPPAVLLLSAYSRFNVGHAQHINRVPVVITSLNIPYPSDVDYVPTSKGVPMPSVMSIDMSLAETHSASEYENFSLGSYKSGTLGGF